MVFHVYESLSGRPVPYPVRRAIRFKAIPPGGRFKNGYDSWAVWSGEQFLRLESGVWVHQPEPTLDADREVTTDQAVRWFRDHPMHLRWDDTGEPMTADDLRSRWRIVWDFPEELRSDHAATFGPPAPAPEAAAAGASVSTTAGPMAGGPPPAAPTATPTPEANVDDGHVGTTGDRAPTDANEPNVILGRPGEKPRVKGKEKPPLSKARFNVVAALLKAGDEGLSKDDLAQKSGHGDAHRVLGRLAKEDADWASVIQMAGRPGCGYRILTR